MSQPDIATAKLPPRDHNQPPPTPFEAASERCDLLHLEATNWLDGDPIANEGQASALAKLLCDVREAEGEADAARKAEARRAQAATGQFGCARYRTRAITVPSRSTWSCSSPGVPLRISDTLIVAVLASVASTVPIRIALAP